jgi:glyoxylase-like metal-dependent hydrolase (beta-lactamase superfamily II)
MIRAKSTGALHLLMPALGFVTIFGSSSRANAQGLPHQTEHPFKPEPIQTQVLRAKYASTAGLEVLPAQGNIYVIFGAGGNIVASVGVDGIALANTGLPENADKVLATLQKLGDAVDPSSESLPVPIRLILNTDVTAASSGGNEKIQAAAKFVDGGEHIMAHENVLARMSEPPAGQTKPPRPSEAWPTDTYRNETNKFGRFFNGEGVQLIHLKNSHTDGNSVIWFRYSDVMVVGDIFNPAGWPMIDLEKGGSFQGVLDGLNLILRTGISDFRTEGGTMIVPGHGRITDLADLGLYRDALTIIRDRIQDGIKRGLTLDQVKAARPTQGWEAYYGSKTGPWTTDMFIEAAYKSLSQSKAK